MNVQNKTLFIADNLDIMRGIDSETIDLIYLDPPFNTKKEYKAPIGSPAEGASFKDIWTDDDIKDEWHGQIAEEHEALYQIIQSAEITQDTSMKIYLMAMAIRLFEMKRLLKPTGSIYLHCDPTASHYLKLVMDSLFGKDMFRSEIIWRRSNAHSKTTRQYGPIHDTLLFYSKSRTCTFHPGTRPYTKAYIESRFTKEDERGRYQTNYLTGSGQRHGDSGEEWRGFNPTAVNRHWAIPRSLRPYLPNEGLGMSSREMLECLFEQDLIVFPRRQGGQPMYKQYIGDGVPYQDIWAYQPNTRGVLFESDEHIDQDVKWLENEPEKTGYPTQKPLGLLSRIIETSSNPDEIVLDPFCGCATACVAAEKLGRRWIGIDISPSAEDITRIRLQDEVDDARFQPYSANWSRSLTNIVVSEDPPVRTDPPGPPRQLLLQDFFPRLPSAEYSQEQLLEFLSDKHRMYGNQEGKCNGCQVLFPFRNMTIDHFHPQSIIADPSHPDHHQIPQSIIANPDHPDNLQLLCGACNSTKGNRSQEDLINRLRENGIIS